MVTDRRLLAEIAAVAEYGRFIAEAGACLAIVTSDSG
jgi:hypothetical protein